MSFSADERSILTIRPTGGPCLDLTAWFEAPPAPGAIARRLCRDRAVAFGPCEPDSFAADLARGEPSGRVEIDPRGDTECRIVLALPRSAGAGKILLELAECRSFDPPEACAWLRPDTASRALGFGDWQAPGCDFAWSNPQGAAAMVPLYRRLAAWWSQLASGPDCAGLWLGYEGCDDGALAHALRYPGHLITESLIADSSGWAESLRIDDRHAAIPLHAVMAASADA